MEDKLNSLKSLKLNPKYKQLVKDEEKGAADIDEVEDVNKDMDLNEENEDKQDF